MAKLTRRKLITQVSVGTGAVGVIAIAAACGTENTTQTTPVPPKTAHPLAVFVTDPDNGVLAVMKDDREITVKNADLARQLLALA